MTYCHENGLFNGTILVDEQGQVIYDKAWGYADFQSKKPLTNDAAFYLASVSKQFTTMAVMMLKEQGKLSYDDPLSKYFPEFPPYANTVTIRHMMTHTSGIPDHYRLGAGRPGLNNNDVFNLLIQQDTLDFTPGERYSYSNGGYILLSMIVEKVTGQLFSSYMKEHIFDPLGMNNTLVFDESNTNVINRTIGYTPFGKPDDYNLYTTGAGGMYTTTGDLHKWDRALYTEQLVSQATLEDAFTPFQLNDGKTRNYGFGWRIQEDSLTKKVFHTGGMAGFRTFLLRDITHKNAIIMLTNKGDAFPLGPMVTALTNILEGKPYTLPQIPVSLALYDLAKDGKMKKVNKQYRKLKQKHADKYDCSEEELNNLGYLLIAEEDLEAAKGIFKLNVDNYPQGFNTYDSYAEACMLLGEYDLARINYKKSLELNPENTNAEEMLKKLAEKEAKPQK
ncbi:MAG: penicillin-binding protein 4* [Saprospiraceae bacterium]|nr:MAG: penicillin-binding protein 4* [Saprospiraceae bacterium]